MLKKERKKSKRKKQSIQKRLSQSKQKCEEQRAKLEDAARKGVSFKVSLPDDSSETVTCGCIVF